MTRIRNYRASFNFTAIEPVASNFFPVNAFSECSAAQLCGRCMAVLVLQPLRGCFCSTALRFGQIIPDKPAAA